jgi:hypothetical protein
MGGPGSTRWNAETTRPVVEATPQLDVCYLARAGLLEPGATSLLTWRNRGPDVATGALRRSCQHIEVRTSWGADLAISVTTTTTSFGGARRWLVCPSCGRRAGVLYAGGYGFACRGCAHLAYASTRENAMDRALERVQAFHRRLGGTGAVHEPLPRPKGMHRRTYARLLRALSAAESAMRGAVREWIRQEDEEAARRGWHRVHDGIDLGDSRERTRTGRRGAGAKPQPRRRSQAGAGDVGAGAVGNELGGEWVGRVGDAPEERKTVGIRVRNGP